MNVNYDKFQKKLGNYLNENVGSEKHFFINFYR